MVSLIEEIETRVRETTHDRIRGLAVREDHGCILIQGQAPTHHARQLALHGALQLLSGDRLRAEITVGQRDGEGRSSPRALQLLWSFRMSDEMVPIS
jgi:hypothetical protein